MPESSAVGPLFSVVVPVFNSEKILPTLLTRLDDFFDAHAYRREYVFVNDGSLDSSWLVLEQLQRQRDDIVAIDLMRNSGQHSAVLCGLRHSRGDYVVTIDDDLQNPPEEIGRLIEKSAEGHDVVFGEFHEKMHGVVRRWGTRVIGWLNNRLFNKPKDLTLTNVRCIRRDVVDAVCELNTSAPYIQGMLLMTARSFANVRIRHDSRPVGRSGYTWKVILALVWRLLISYSAYPLRVLCSIGIVTAAASFVFGAVAIVRSLMNDIAVQGWTTIVVLLSFYHGLALAILAALAEYVVRIVNDLSGPPAYRIRVLHDDRTAEAQNASKDQKSLMQ